MGWFRKDLLNEINVLIRTLEKTGKSTITHNWIWWHAKEGKKDFHQLEDIDVAMTVDEVDVEKQQRALDRYVTYQQTIGRAEARRNFPREAAFEIYQEAHDPPLDGLLDGMR